jgi:hypothetical protein
VTELLRAPFPWFGGKRRVADVAWRALGADVANYVEPFAGSLAVLLGRPGGAGKIETVNDIDRYLANFWRAIQHAPGEVAEWADGPVNEADMHARHLWLVNQKEFRERMHTDPDFFDAKIAGWWVWGICQWIGGGWCTVPWQRKRPRMDAAPGTGVHGSGRERAHWQQRPAMTGDHPGNGVHSEAAYSPGRRPSLGSEGQGVHLSRQMPELRIYGNGDGATGKGIHSGGFLRKHEAGARLPSLGNDRGISGVAAPPCLDWFLALQERLRRVRVACGDWKRVLGPSVLGKGKNVGGRRPCGVFLDPPYSHELRDNHLYSEDDVGIAEAVRTWAIEHGDDPDLRIAFCGYEDGREMPPGWTAHAWKGARGYAGQDNTNRELERIWLSRHCLPLEPETERQGLLFGSVVAGGAP